MKTLAVLFLSLVSTAAFAQEGPVLVCSTAGDALDLVEVTQKRGEATLEITYMSEAVESFRLEGALEALRAGEPVSLVGKKRGSLEFGGGVSQAALLTVLPGQREARLAASGMVYVLSCSR